jgi:hypothetical protein
MEDDKNIADIYQEILEEKSDHGDEKSVRNLLGDAIKAGLVRAKETKNGYMVQSLTTPHQELIHRGERSLHYLRRFLQKIQNNA